MNKYCKSYIYGIKCNTTNLLYIGSSIEPMKVRLSKHLTDLKGYLGINPKPRNYRTSFEVLMNDDYEIFKIKELPNCKNKQELETIETLYILNNECVNKQRPRKINKEDYEGDYSLPSLI